MMDVSPREERGPTPATRSIATVAPPRVLVAYATRHGSTADIADWIADELREAGAEVTRAPVSTAGTPAGYDAVILGGPMILGWHKQARRYLHTHRRSLEGMPLALFIVCASLTETGAGEIRGVPVTTDPWLVTAPRQPGRLSRKERYATPAHYLEDAFRAAPELSPASVAFFGGSLDLTKMNFVERLFVMLAIRATPGDARNRQAVREWARRVATEVLA